MTKLVLLRGSAFMAVPIYFSKSIHTEIPLAPAREVNLLYRNICPFLHTGFRKIQPEGSPPPFKKIPSIISSKRINAKVMSSELGVFTKQLFVCLFEVFFRHSNQGHNLGAA
jgi:hypothetical protein